MDAVELLMHDHRMVEQLFQEEEGQFLPALRQAVDEQALTDVGEQLDMAKKVAPARPHPAAPDEPPALTLAAPLVAVYDRFRDRVQGRPKT